MKKSLLILSLLLMTLLPVSCCCGDDLEEKTSTNEASQSMTKDELAQSLADSESNINNFTYSVSKGGEDENYGNIIKGIETVEDPANKCTMRVVSQENIEEYGDEEQKITDVKILNDLLDGNPPVAYEKYDFMNDLYNLNNNVNRLFYDAFPGVGSDLSGEISTISNANFDKIKAYYTLDGQNPPHAWVAVTIYAKKDNNYYMFYSESDFATTDKEWVLYPKLNECTEKYGYEDKARQCFVEVLMTDQEFQDLISEKAGYVLDTFPKVIVDSQEARRLLNNKNSI